MRVRSGRAGNLEPILPAILAAALLAIPAPASSFVPEARKPPPETIQEQIDDAWDVDCEYTDFNFRNVAPIVSRAWEQRYELDEILLPRIDEDDHRALCEHLEFTDEQRAIADLHFADYERERRRVVQAIYDVRPLRSNRLRELDATWRQLERILDEHARKIEALRPPKDRPEASTATTTVRGFLLRRAALDEFKVFPGYGQGNFHHAGDNLDLVRLVRETAPTIRTLERLLNEPDPAVSHDAASSPSPSPLADPRIRLRETLRVHDLQLDAWLGGAVDVYRSSRADFIIARGDRLHRLNERTAEHIAAILLAAGDAAAAEQWTSAYRRAAYPGPYHPIHALVDPEETLARADLTPAQRVALERACEQYRRSLEDLRRTGLERLLRHRRDMHPLLDGRGGVEIVTLNEQGWLIYRDLPDMQPAAYDSVWIQHRDELRKTLHATLQDTLGVDEGYELMKSLVGDRPPWPDPK